MLRQERTGGHDKREGLPIRQTCAPVAAELPPPDPEPAVEILDLRHFSAPTLLPLLDVESDIWRRRLHWDYRVSARLLMQYLDNRLLPGFAAVVDGQVIGYTFCVYEENKAILGDLFAAPGLSEAAAGLEPQTIEARLLTHLLELLTNSPAVDRIESQLLLHPSGSEAALFRLSGFELYRRLYMMRSLNGVWSTPRPELPAGLELRPWRDEDLAPASRLIVAAYDHHPDGVINDQYHTTQGALRFLNNIVRYAGCGSFSASASHVIVERGSQELVALALGSRISAECGHVTQLCVHPRYHRLGLARQLLGLAAFHFMRQGVASLSLTVTETNRSAIALYQSEEYSPVHCFDAAVWLRR